MTDYTLHISDDNDAQEIIGDLLKTYCREFGESDLTFRGNEIMTKLDELYMARREEFKAVGKRIGVPFEPQDEPV